MAQLAVRDGDLVLQLTLLERAEVQHGDLRVPLSAVSAVDVLGRAMEAMDDCTPHPTSMPGRRAVGTYRRNDQRMFAAVHLGGQRGVRIRLEGERHQEWVVGCSDPEAVARDLRAALAP